MRDFTADHRWLSINTATVRKQRGQDWPLLQIIDACAARGIRAIAPWRDQVHAAGLAFGALDGRVQGDDALFLADFAAIGPGSPPAYEADVRALAGLVYRMLTGQTEATPGVTAPLADRLAGLMSGRATMNAADLAALLSTRAGSLRRPESLDLRIGRRTDVGQLRELNEDSLLTLDLVRSNKSISRPIGLFVVADGMGGYAAGEVASQLAVDVMAEAFKTNTFAGTPDPERPHRGDELCQAIEMANLAILTQARANEAQAGMGTTVVSARFSPNKQRVYIAHVGDSRLYRLRGGEIRQLTTDHTLGAAGITGPSASKLSRAVGIMDLVEVELTIDAPKVGDYYLLCSDGLSKMVPDEMIKQIIDENAEINRACERLVETANERGGRDNVSVILVHVEQPHSSQRPPEVV